jgi:endoglucanase
MPNTRLIWSHRQPEGPAAFVINAPTTNLLTSVGPILPPGVFQVGVNIAGLEFTGTFYPVPTTADIDYFYALGARRFRLPVSWDHIQPTLNAPLDTTVLGHVTTLVDYCISLGVKCLIDIHSFGYHNGVPLSDGTLSPTGQAIPPSTFADLWSRIATAMVGKNSNFVQFDLMNEPVNLPGGEPSWVAHAKAAITAIRLIDHVKIIYVEGYQWASTWNWLAMNPDLHTVRAADPYNRLVISGHAYLDHDNSGTNFNYTTESGLAGTAPPGVNTGPDILVARITDFLNWGVSHGFRMHVGELGCPADNTNPRAAGDLGWQVALRNGLLAMQTSGAEFDIWAGGPAWGAYPQSVAPYNGRQSRTITTLQEFWGNTLTPSNYFVDGPHRGSAGSASAPFYIDYRGARTPFTVTPVAVSGGTWTPASVTLSGVNPVASFTLNVSTAKTVSVSFTNNGGLSDPPALVYTTEVDDFATVEPILQNVFSFERKVAGYQGQCIRLRRSSDNAESDFGFASPNAMYAYLDTAAITTWKGASTNMYVVKQYNQAFYTNPNDAVPPYTDSNAGTAVLADQPEFVLNAGDGYPAILWNNANRMDWESPLELATGQVIITNTKYIDGGDLVSFSFTNFSSQWMPCWQLYTGQDTNVYGTDSEVNFPAICPEPYEWHVYAGSWTGSSSYGTRVANGIKIWRDGHIVSLGDVGSDTLTVDFHRNQINLGYSRFGGVFYQGHSRDIICLNGPVSDALVATIQGRMVTKYGTDTNALPAADINLDFAANTYTVDGAGSTLAANILNTPVRDANGLICDTTKTYEATGPLLAALAGDEWTIQIDTKNCTNTSYGAFLLLTSAGVAKSYWGWNNSGYFYGTTTHDGTTYFNNMGSSLGYQYPGDDLTEKLSERRHTISMSKLTNFIGSSTEGECWDWYGDDGPPPGNVPNYNRAYIGNWLATDPSSENLVGRIVRIKAWRKKLSKSQQFQASENLPTKLTVPTPFMQGVNLAGMDFGGGLIGGQYAEFYPSQAEIQMYADQGFKLARIPFTWERTQPVLLGALRATEIQHLVDIVGYCQSVGIVALLDLHNYAQYYDVNGYNEVLGLNYPADSRFLDVHFVDFWDRMSQVSAFNSANVWFGLMNEPANWAGVTSWFNSCKLATAAIRAHNTVSTIAVPTNVNATMAGLWARYSGAEYLSTYTDSANKSVVEVHQYFDNDNSGTHAAVVKNRARFRLVNMVRWARVHNQRFIIGETGWDNNPYNNQAQVEGNECLRLLRNADDVFAGFCYWAGGPGWGPYFQSCEPYFSLVHNLGYTFIPRGDRPQMSLLKRWETLP